MENQCKVTDFGVSVKTKLLLCGKTQQWLQEEVSKRTGLFVDGSYLCKIFTGERNAPKIVQAIKDVLEINDAPTE